MSHNLRLTDARSGASCELFQTTSGATDAVMCERGNADRAEAYFRWLREECEPSLRLGGRAHGAFLDHKIEVLTFLVTYPNAEFSST